VRPAPEIPVPVPTVMPLYPMSQGLTAKHAIIQRDFAREDRIRMWRPRKSNPTLAAQLHAKGRPISQIPTNSLPRNLNTSSAFVLTNPVLLNLQEKGTSTMLAQSPTVHAKTLDWESLYPSLRFPRSRKPSRPHLHSLPQRIARTPASPRIHQQIPEPPSSAPIAQSHPQKPNLIPPPHRNRAEPFVKRLHTSRRITPQPFVHFFPPLLKSPKRN